jgi:uncharacterized membrane protein YbhN (UPF0104 family)
VRVAAGSSTARRGGMVLAGVAALCLPFFAVPLATGTSWAAISGRLGSLSAIQLVGLASIWLLGLYIHTYVTTGVLPQLTHGRAMVLNFSGSSAAQLMPFGGILGMGLSCSMLRSWGFSGRHFTTLTVLTTAYNFATKLLLPSCALALLLIAGDPSCHALLLASTAGLAVFLLLASVAVVAVRAGRRTSRGPGRRTGPVARAITSRAGVALGPLREELRSAVRRSWHRMTTAVIGYAVAQATLLFLCVRSVGGHLGPLSVFAAYATGSALTLVPLTPGGVGFAEAGTATLLVALGGGPATATAAVLLYSTFTRLGEIPFGAVGTAWWWVRRAAGSRCCTSSTRPEPAFGHRIEAPGGALAGVTDLV